MCIMGISVKCVRSIRVVKAVRIKRNRSNRVAFWCLRGCSVVLIIMGEVVWLGYEK